MPAIRKGRKFFLDRNLYRIEGFNRPNDECYCTDLQTEKQVILPLSMVRKRATRAYWTKEAGELINRSRKSLANLALSGELLVNPITIKNKDLRKGEDSWWTTRIWWDDEAIMCAHQYFLDKTRTSRINRDLPTKAELIGFLRNDGIITYVKNNDGEFVPIFKSLDM